MIAAGTRKDVFHHLVRHHAQKGRRYRMDCYPYRCPECNCIMLELDEAKDHDIRKHGICWATVGDRVGPAPLWGITLENAFRRSSGA